MTSSDEFVVLLTEAEADLALVGGKACSLGLLARTDLPVPDGFVLTTRAYQAFVETNGLQTAILDLVSSEGAERKILELFQGAEMPVEIEASIVRAYEALPSATAVAVRSSATAEDLPDMSFAGQQDSFLNVRSKASLLDAVRLCWASLWSERAISYRTRMQVDHGVIAMGVIVQNMVEAETSGVLFTANPTNGDRSELVVNASFGLGEAIVGGQVTPDTYLLDRETLNVKQTVLGTKQNMVVSGPQHGTAMQPVPESQRLQSSVPEDVLRTLAQLSLSAEHLLGGLPQDIEWAVNDNQVWLLQSRPITSLPPQNPDPVIWQPPNGAKMLVRRQVVENMPEPLSVLFEELYLGEGLDRGMDAFTATMGLPINVGDFIYRPMFVTVNGYGYCRYDMKFSWRMLLTIPKILYWYVTGLPKFMKNILPLWRDEGLPDYLALIEEWDQVDIDTASDETLLSGVRALAMADATYWYYITMMVGVAKITEGMLSWLLSSRSVSSRSGRGNLTSGMFLNGFSSKTRQAHLELVDIAATISASESLRKLVLAHAAGDLLTALHSEPDASGVLQDIRQHLKVYGHQIYNLDFAAATQGEDPLPVLFSLKSLVEDPAKAAAAEARQIEMADDRENLRRETTASLGPIRRRMFIKFLSWAEKFGPFREDALFYMGGAWPALRRLALELGRRLAEIGTLTDADSVFNLSTNELAQASAARAENQARADLLSEAESRQALREARMRLHPPGRVPEDLRIRFGPFDVTRLFEVWETQKYNALDTLTLHGFAVSAGRVTGVATVIASTADFAQMQPNTILVCATTTPAWTPLFGQAIGLVTDIGGVLAHGSIVAREYGIPAVLGTGNVTQRVVTGQMITVDGDAGTVTLLD
jgi:phosphohistidine swiveling domain-containing protein